MLVQGDNGVHLLLELLLQEALVAHQMHIQGVVVVGQAVRHHFQVPQFRRKAAQGLDEAGIPVYLHIQGGHNAVVRGAGFVEVPEFLGHLFQGIADIKGVVLLLGIQHQGQVVALFDNVHHALALNGVLAFHPRLGFSHLPIVVIQFPAQVGQRCIQIHARKHGHGRHCHGKQPY